MVDTTGSGTHVEDVERMSQSHFHDLPFIMSKMMLMKNVVFCARGVNLVASSTSADKTSPFEQFTGRKLDAKIDLRISFGDYVQAINPKKDNQVENANTHGFVAVRQTGSLNGSVEMWRISTRAFVTRDQFTVLPMPDEVIKLLDKMAEKDGITRESVLFEMPDLVTDNEDEENRGPTYKEITDDRVSADVDGVEVDDVKEDNTTDDPEPEVPIESDLRTNEQRKGTKVPEPQADWVRRSVRFAQEIGLVIETGQTKKRSTACRLAGDKPVLVENLFKRLSEQDCDSARRAIRREIECRSQYHDVQFAFKISVKAVMRDCPKEALPVIEAELRQMHDKTV